MKSCVWESGRRLIVAAAAQGYVRLWHSKCLLPTIVENSHLIPEDKGEDVRRAWESIQVRFSELITRLDELNPQEQLGVRNSRWVPLDEHGLTGDELRLKRRGFVGRPSCRASTAGHP